MLLITVITGSCGGLFISDKNQICDSCLVNDGTCLLGNLYGHPDNCSLFYQCTPVGLTLRTCAPGSEFDMIICNCWSFPNTECQQPCDSGTVQDGAIII